MSSLFNLTTLFRAGAEAFGSLDAEAVKGLLERLAANTPLSPDEVESRELFDKMTLASDWIQHIVERAGAQQTSLEDLRNELAPLLDDDHIKFLLRYYQLFLKRLIEDSERSSIVPRHLDDVKWRVDLTLATGDLSKVIEPTALLQFELSSAAKDEKVQHLLKIFYCFHFLGNNRLPFQQQNNRNLSPWNLTKHNYTSFCVNWI